jgi:hypothetical protein
MAQLLRAPRLHELAQAEVWAEMTPPQRGMSDGVVTVGFQPLQDGFPLIGDAAGALQRDTRQWRGVDVSSWAKKKRPGPAPRAAQGSTSGVLDLAAGLRATAQAAHVQLMSWAGMHHTRRAASGAAVDACVRSCMRSAKRRRPCAATQHCLRAGPRMSKRLPGWAPASSLG